MVDGVEIQLDESRVKAEERNRRNYRCEVAEKDLEISSARRLEEDLRGSCGDVLPPGVVYRQQAGDSVPEEPEKSKLLRREKARLLVVYHKTYSGEQLESYPEEAKALLLRGAYDEEIVQIEDCPNPSRMQEGLERLRHQSKDEGREAKTEGEDEIFVYPLSPPEAKEAAEATIDGDVEVGVLQIDRCAPIAGAKKSSRVLCCIHPEVWSA